MSNITYLNKASRFFLFFILATFTFSCGSTRNSIAVEEGWELLGETKAGFVRETDVINVNSSNEFTALRFKVEGHEIKLSDLSVYFESGDKLSPAIDELVPAGHESRIIDLALEGRKIIKIEFRYRTNGSVFKGKANVLVFGKRYHIGY